MFVDEIVLPFKSRLSTFNCSNLELLFVINALLACSEPCEWFNKSVKYLPPIVWTLDATPLPSSAPVPIYNLSPACACPALTDSYEYANSPVFRIDGAEVVLDVVKIFNLVLAAILV